MEHTNPSPKVKKLVNDPNQVVREMIDGLVLAHPHLKSISGKSVIVRADCREEDVLDHRVALISGGGSGHEPAHAGFVGRGMLTAAVLGIYK